MSTKCSITIDMVNHAKFGIQFTENLDRLVIAFNMNRERTI